MNATSKRHSTRHAETRGETFRALTLIALVQLATLALSSQGRAQGYTLLYSFQCGPNDGAYPSSGLVLDSAGNLYGTTSEGGAYNVGTVFELTSQGSENLLHNFEGPPTDGMAPGYGALIRDGAGNLYGTTVAGGAAGFGTVFRLAPNGTETILASLSGSTGGAYSGLLRDPAGNLYGTGYGSGGGYGTVWEVAPNGKLTTLYAFQAGKDGHHPVGDLIRDSAGNLYGTTYAGGQGLGTKPGLGTVFTVFPGGEETAYSLTREDGLAPEAGVIRDPAGNLYGTAAGGGISNFGTVFRLSATGTLSTLHRFTSSPDGATPFSGLVRDPSGDFYGMTELGGTGTCTSGTSVGCGTIFEISSKGQESVLYSFAGAPDGFYPLGSALLRDSSGNLYGTTVYGGAYGCGTVFKFTP